MTPQQIAERLPELTGTPHDDDAITALAQITAEAIRALNHATFTHAGLEQPATVNAVLGQLAAAAHRLPQLCGQLAGWLRQHHAAGRLAQPRRACPALSTMPWPAWTALPGTRPVSVRPWT